MEEPKEIGRLVVEKHACRNCGKTNEMIILKKGNKIPDSFKNALRVKKITVIFEGEIFECPNPKCRHKVTV